MSEERNEEKIKRLRAMEKRTEWIAQILSGRLLNLRRAIHEMARRGLLSRGESLQLLGDEAWMEQVAWAGEDSLLQEGLRLRRTIDAIRRENL